MHMYLFSNVIYSGCQIALKCVTYSSINGPEIVTIKAHF